MNDPVIDQEEAEPRFLLTTGPVERRLLSSVLEILAPAALLLEDAPANEDIKSLAHEQGVALLAKDDADLAIEIDGIHLTDAGQIAETRLRFDQTRPDRLILGAAIGLSRHAAMIAGDEGADYVAFGKAEQSADEAVVELVCWWHEVTIMPCLAYAKDADAVTKLASIGTDFIAIGEGLWKSPGGPIAAAETLSAAIKTN